MLRGPTLRRPVALRHDLRLAYFDLGCVEVALKDNDAAIAAFKEAEKLDPSEPDAHYRLGRIYMALGEKEKADAEFLKTKTLHQKEQESIIDKMSGPKPTGVQTAGPEANSN